MSLITRIRIPLQTTFLDYPDPVSNAVSVYFMGCEHKCKGCYNPLFQDPLYSVGTQIVAVEEFLPLLHRSCEKNKTDKIVLLGGDPLHILNISFVRKLLKEIKDTYNTCIYTGCGVEESKIILDEAPFTYLKCGQYDLTKKQNSTKTEKYILFSSSNQELYDSNYNLLSKDGKYIFDVNKICDEDDME